MSGLLLVVLVALIFLILYQVGRSSEMIAVMQGYEAFDRRRNQILGYSMLAVWALLMVGIYYTHAYMVPKMNLMPASDHGEEIDRMFNITLALTGIVFFVTQFLTFWFAFRYRDNGINKPFFFAHSNKLEIIWTTIPALTMAILVAFGLKAWFNMTSAAPKDSMIVEVIGKQFNWIMRYPGPDGKLGKRYYTNINEENNILGLDWNDPATKDDIIIPSGELRLIKGKPVELIIGSRDVIHDVGLPHFRLKMDAVPGITSRLWFTPTISTAEMKQKTGNPDFVYEISCDQMCGKGHYSMRGIVVVESEKEHKEWLAKQQSYYAQTHTPQVEDAPAVSDSTGVEEKNPATAKN